MADTSELVARYAALPVAERLKAIHKNWAKLTPYERLALFGPAKKPTVAEIKQLERTEAAE